MELKFGWESTYFFLQACLQIDSLLYICDHLSQITNCDANERIKERRNCFYRELAKGIECCQKETGSPQKKDIKNQDPFNKIYYERDKNVSHPDLDYVYKDGFSLKEQILELQKQFFDSFNFYKGFLPKGISFEFFAHDPVLFRQVHGISKEIEEALKGKQQIIIALKDNYNKRTLQVFYGKEKHGIDPLELKKCTINSLDIAIKIKQHPELQNEYALFTYSGINGYEGMRRCQETCILMNIAYAQDNSPSPWPTLNQVLYSTWRAFYWGTYKIPGVRRKSKTNEFFLYIKNYQWLKRNQRDILSIPINEQKEQENFIKGATLLTPLTKRKQNQLQRKMVRDFISRFSKNIQYENPGISSSNLCYYFTLCLAHRFSELSPVLMFSWKEKYFGCQINGRVYDITGDVTHEYNWIMWKSFCEEEPSISEQIKHQYIYLDKHIDTQS